MLTNESNGTVYRQIVMMLGGAVIVTAFGLAGWLLRADHDNIRDASVRALELALEGEKTDISFRIEVSQLHAEVTNLRNQLTNLTESIKANQQEIKANQAKILALLGSKRRQTGQDQ